MLNGSEPQDGSIMRLTRFMVSEIIYDRKAASLKLLGFEGAYPDEDVQQLLNTCSETERRKVIEGLYERARAKGLTR
jgi:hypothetical protein